MDELEVVCHFRTLFYGVGFFWQKLKTRLRNSKLEATSYRLYYIVILTSSAPKYFVHLGWNCWAIFLRKDSRSMGDERFSEKYIYFGILRQKLSTNKIGASKTAANNWTTFDNVSNVQFFRTEGDPNQSWHGSNHFGPEVWIDRATVSTKQDTKGANNS